MHKIFVEFSKGIKNNFKGFEAISLAEKLFSIIGANDCGEADNNNNRDDMNCSCRGLLFLLFSIKCIVLYYVHLHLILSGMLFKY